MVGGEWWWWLAVSELSYSFSLFVLFRFLFLSYSTTDNWVLVKRILRYLKGTSNYGLFFSKSLNTHLNVYTDADWASCVDDRKSTSGYAIFMGKNLVS